MPNNPKPDSRPSSTVITVPDPDNMPVSSNVEKGGTIEWRTDTHNYPNFEIRFQGANPFDTTPDLVLTGSDEKPVIMRLNTLGHDYAYKVRHHHKKDRSHRDTGVFKFNVNPCRGCP
jgi:hypothetical protein